MSFWSGIGQSFLGGASQSAGTSFGNLALYGEPLLGDYWQDVALDFEQDSRQRSYSDMLNYQEKSLEQQYQKQMMYDMNSALNMPSWKVQGLRKANLNPILAVTNGTIGGGNSFHGSVGGTSQGSSIPQASGNGSSIAQNRLMDRQRELIQTQEDNVKSSSELNRANAQSNLMTAKAQTENAETAKWMMYDAKAMHDAGITAFVAKPFGLGTKEVQVHTIRINKVTGDCYDLQGNKVKVVNGVPKSTTSAKKTEEARQYYQQNNYYYSNGKSDGSKYHINPNDYRGIND